MQSITETQIQKNVLKGFTTEYPLPRFDPEGLARLELDLLKQLSLGIKEKSTGDSLVVLLTDQYSIEISVAHELTELYSRVLDSVVNDEPWKCIGLLTEYHCLLSEHSGLFYNVSIAVLIHSRILFLIGSNTGELPSFSEDLTQFWAIIYRVMPEVIEGAVVHRLFAFQTINYQNSEHTDWEKVGEELLLFYSTLKTILLQHVAKKE